MKITPEFIKNIIRGTSFYKNRINRAYSWAIVDTLRKKDEEAIKNKPQLKELHLKLGDIAQDQMANWKSHVYTGGYYYQGYQRIGINGIKPTELRFANYQISRWLTSEKTVLDIGSNAGFMACYLAEFVKEVDAIELNPFLVKMGVETKRFLNIENVNFIESDFATHTFNKKYDIVFSLSNHYTIDGNLNVNFEFYINKVFNLMSDKGILFFESHNIHGDDSDMDQKFLIASKYFELFDYKMVKAFYQPDIDKLFAIFIRRPEISDPQQFNFKLEDAQRRYEYSRS